MNDLKVIVVNCRSIKNKNLEFASVLDLVSPHVVIGTESWLDSTISDSEIFPSNYRIYRKDRNVQGGGVFVMIHSSLNSTHINVQSSSCETVWCRIILTDGTSLAVGSFYRPPGSNSPQPLYELNNVLLSLDATYIVLGGDFNLPNINWIGLQPNISTPSPIYSAVREMINAHSLFQFVQVPTRITPNSANTLDLLFCSDRTLISSVDLLPGVSDHEIVLAHLSCLATYCRNPSPRLVFCYDKADYASLARELDEFLPVFQKLASSIDVEPAWNELKTKLLSLTSSFVPSRVITSKRRADKPWMSRSIRALINRRHRLYRRYCRLPKPDLYSDLKKLGKEIAKEMRKAESRYLETLGEKIRTNPKEVWKYVRSKRSSKDAIPDVIDDNNYGDDYKGKAEQFNSYFESVFIQSTPQASGVQATHNFSQMSEITFSEEGIANLLQKVNVKSAPGPDNISNYVIKNCAVSLAPFLAILFQKSFDSGTLPNDWKTANVVPIFKSGDNTKTRNYRPISLTSVSCKALEHIIYSNLMAHLQENNFFSPTQHGFRRGLSCDTQLVEFSHDIALSFNNGKQVDCIFLDFQKAFDSVAHNLLLIKLSALNIPTVLLHWIEAYLDDRKQCVVLNGTSSSYRTVLSGVPQGSVLGPLLFLIFINDIGEQVLSHLRLYADDCCLYREITSLSDSAQLQNDLDVILLWCNKWNMRLNFSKCNVVRFTNKRHIFDSKYCLDGENLSIVSNYKYLGVLYKNDFSWNDHINYVAAKAGRVLNFLKRNFKKAPPKLKETLYFSNVRTILEYGCSAWDPGTKTCIAELERIQKRAARFVSSNYDFTISSSDIRADLGWPTLQDRRKYMRLKLFHKIFVGATGLRKETYILDPTYRSARRDHSLKVREYSSRINVYKHSFFPRTCHDWNSLPEEVVLSPISSFDSALAEFLFK